MPWEHIDDLDLEVASAGAAVYGELVVVAGGLEENNRKAFIYDPIAHEKTDLPDLPYNVESPVGVVVVDDFAYVLGPFPIKVSRIDLTNPFAWETDSAWTYSPNGFDWIPHGGMKVASDGVRFIYIYASGDDGGDGGPGTVTTFRRLDTNDMTYDELPDPPVDHDDNNDVGDNNGSAWLTEDGIFHVLDCDGSGVNIFLSEHQAFDTATLLWLAQGTYPPPPVGFEVIDHSAFGQAVFNGDSIVVTGLDTNHTYPEPFYLSTLIWTPATGWLPLADLWTDTLHYPLQTTAVVIGEFLYTIGGPDVGDVGADPPTRHREVWRLEIVLPRRRRFEDVDLAHGTPTHMFVSRHGGAVQPVVADAEVFEQANGGLMSASGRIRASDVKAAPEVLKERSDWWMHAKETGQPLFKGALRPPSESSGVVDIVADGIGKILAETEFETLLYADDGTANWRNMREQPFNLHAPPKDGPKGFTIDGGTGVLGLGVYKYAVTFVTAEGESGLGPTGEIEVLIGEEPANIHLKDVPKGGPSVTARKIYRKDPGDAFHLLATLADNTTEVYDDSTADVSVNALPPKQASADPVTAAITRKGMEIHVAKDEYVLADQRAGFVWHLNKADATAWRFNVDQNRSLEDWEFGISTAEKGKGDFLEELILDLDGEESKQTRLDFDNNDDIDVVRIEFRRKSGGADSEPVDILIHNSRVYGAAPDDDFSTSDVARDICRRLNVSDALVKPTDAPALPAVFTDSNYGAVLDLEALLTEGGDYRWLFLMAGTRTVCDFGPTKRRRWILMDPEIDPPLTPLPRYNRVKVYDPDGIMIAEARANPNLLDYRATAPAVKLPIRLSDENAQLLARSLANYYVKPRWIGRIPFTRVLSDSGIPTSRWAVHGGDQLLHPKMGVWVTVDQLVHGDNGISTADLPQSTTVVDRYIARLELRHSA